MIVPSLIVLAVIAVVAAMSWVLIGNGLPAGSGTSTSADGSTQSATSGATTPGGTGTAGTTTAQPTPAQTGTVDRTTRLRVLNNTATAGLARQAGQALTDNGWKVAQVGNAVPRNTVSATTVYYARDAQIATATAVADELGAQIAKDAKMAQTGLTVVLGPDYQP
jgi:hypothetical protein